MNSTLPDNSEKDVAGGVQVSNKIIFSGDVKRPNIYEDNGLRGFTSVSSHQLTANKSQTEIRGSFGERIGK